MNYFPDFVSINMKKSFSKNSSSWFFRISISLLLILVCLICFSFRTHTDKHENAEGITVNQNGIFVTDYSEAIVIKNDKLVTISGDSNYKTKVK